MDRVEIAKLYERYGYAIHRRCWRLLGSEAEADDALQEVFVRVMRYGDGMPGTSPLPWLYRVADRHCFDRLRRRKRREQPGDAERVVAALERAQADSDGRYGGEGGETLQTVARVLAACREAVQETAVLYYVDEMTQDEVASAVGVSRKTVRERLASFLETARELLSLATRGGAR